MSIFNILFSAPTFVVPLNSSHKFSMNQLLSVYGKIEKPVDMSLQNLISSTNNLYSKTISPVKIPSTKDLISVINICYETTTIYPHTQFVCGLYSVENWTIQKNSFNGKYSLIPYEYTPAGVTESLFTGKNKTLT
jgi:hypothetical protein